ncbi:MAG TPA: DUF2235 domain-containing protein [Candidatus Acidoferrum sp.]|nr:DUF2235 domain-containing protein [Candidatus Acidoferrum sp.]
MPKNIIICCDGTGNSFANPDSDSNVIKLYSTLDFSSNAQVGYYHPGVGTLGNPMARNKLSSAWSIVKGLAFGSGLLDNVGDAYRFLMNSYQNGDDVYLFGFSRGAYTVRALAGVLHMFGVLQPGNDGLIPYMLKIYAKKTRDEQRMQQTFAVATSFKASISRECPLHFVGVWDTVSSYGWIYNPVRLPYTAQNPDMRNGRHAISIDERRCFFQKNVWGDPLYGQSIKQVWFAGVHSDVGGSYSERESGLSKLTLEWMMNEALTCGLKFDATKALAMLGTPASADRVPPDPNGPLHNSLTKRWWIAEILPHKYYDEKTKRPKWRIPFGASREIPPNSVLHQSVLDKLALHNGYQPKNLVEPGGPIKSCSIEPRLRPDFYSPPPFVKSSAAGI